MISILIYRLQLFLYNNLYYVDFLAAPVNSLGILYYELRPSQSESDGWIVLNPSSDSITTESTCYSNSLFGGFNIFNPATTITYLIKSIPHSSMQITFSFWTIDAMSDGLQVFVNDQYFNFEFLADASVSNMCLYFNTY